MKNAVEKLEWVRRLQRQIDALQGLGPSEKLLKTGLAPFEEAFPNQTFPTGTIHEFLSYHPSEAASTSAFMATLAGKTLSRGGACLWVGTDRKIFPHGLSYFGLPPEHVIFIDLRQQKDVLWTLEEILKCEAVSTVIGELKELSFTESRRFQLATERSHVTGFIHRYRPVTENNVACATRWKITPLPGASPGLPGVNFPQWKVNLLKARNGRPQNWNIRWNGERFESVAPQETTIPIHAQTLKTG